MSERESGREGYEDKENRWQHNIWSEEIKAVMLREAFTWE